MGDADDTDCFDEYFVCSDCIQEPFLSSEVEKRGVGGCCNLCLSEEHYITTIRDIAGRVHTVLEKCYRQTSPDPEGFTEEYLQREGRWYQSGYPVQEVIQELLHDHDNVITHEVLECLSWDYDAAGKDALCEQQPYDSDAQYDEISISTEKYSEKWQFFKHQIRTKARFFNDDAKSLLEDIFQKIEDLSTYDSSSVVQDIDDAAVFYRSRVALDNDELMDILKGLPQSIGAPGPNRIKSGRMNAAGISVFYGAFDLQTCLNEVRAPVGSYSVVGAFSPTRELRLLNLNVLKRAIKPGSLFDESYIDDLSRIAFLEKLVNEITKPVMPGWEDTDYIYTQVITEFLAAKSELNIDGLIFRSSQVPKTAMDDRDEQFSCSEETQRGCNVVLFNRAAKLKEYDLPPDYEVEVYWSQRSDDEGDVGLTISENKNTNAELSSSIINLDEDGNHGHSLRLDIDSVKVLYVQGVQYSTTEVDVDRFRYDPPTDCCFGLDIEF